jgi:predicted nicotinamide N-methyase
MMCIMVCPDAPADPRMARLRSRLLQRIGKRYQTIGQQIRLTVGGSSLTIDFTRIADPDVVLDEVAEDETRREKLRGSRLSEDELHLPYWAELWDSAPALAQFLADRPHYLHGPPSVLDVGCGMGLSGTVVAALGARVLFADLEPPALLFAALNSLPWRQRIRTRRVNWQAQDLEERFNLVLGADILYERAQWHYLEPFFRRHLAPGGRVLLGEPGRPAGDGFAHWIASRGWSVEEHRQPLASRPEPIRIFELRNLSGRDTDAPPAQR